MSVTVFIVSPSIYPEVMVPDAMILVFWKLSFKSTFSLSFTFIKRLFSSSSLSAIKGSVICICAAAAAAKSLQLCPTLCDPRDGSPPGSPIPGILQARTLEWLAIFFSNAWKWKVKVKLLSRVWLLATPWTAAYQAPPSMGFSRQEYWSVAYVKLLIFLTAILIPASASSSLVLSSHILCRELAMTYCGFPQCFIKRHLMSLIVLNHHCILLSPHQ